MATDDLDAALEAFGARLAPTLAAEIRDDAVAEARDEITRRLVEVLLRRCGQELLHGGERRRPVGGAPPREAEPAAPGPEATPTAFAAPAAPTPTPSHPLVEHARREAVGHYVYGVVAPDTSLPTDLVGVEPTAGVRRIEENGLVALVSEVRLAEFDESALRENLNDVAWLEEKARAHEQVLEAALDVGAVVPLRLCTVFIGEDQVRAMLARERGALIDALERLDSRAEWGVKAYADRDVVEREAIARAGEDETVGEVSAGTAYMNRRRAEERARAEVEEIADEWGQRIHGHLGAIASEALLNPLQQPELSGREVEMFLNGVYLVSDAEAPRFGAAVAALADEFDRRGAEIDLTGPWPAYNFVKSSIEAAR
ncbi:MAG: gvpL2 [Solirubrobacterales bacterium]|nr:gvpL2 [Solirubrobacterales bacterium]